MVFRPRADRLVSSRQRNRGCPPTIRGEAAPPGDRSASEDAVGRRSPQRSIRREGQLRSAAERRSPRRRRTIRPNLECAANLGSWCAREDGSSGLRQGESPGSRAGFACSRSPAYRNKVRNAASPPALRDRFGRSYPPVLLSRTSPLRSSMIRNGSPPPTSPASSTARRYVTMPFTPGSATIRPQSPASGRSLSQ